MNEHSDRDRSEAEEIVARFDSYSQEEHAEGIKAARERALTKRAARRERARAAAHPATASVVHADGPTAPQPSEDTRDGEIEALRAEVDRLRGKFTQACKPHEATGRAPIALEAEKIAAAVARVTPCACSAQRSRAEAAEARADRLAATLAEVRAEVSLWPSTNYMFDKLRAILDREAPA